MSTWWQVQTEEVKATTTAWQSAKRVNGLLGSMSLKEKIEVILNQKGEFKCPNGVGNTKKQPDKPKAPLKAAAKFSINGDLRRKSKQDRVALVLANLKQRRTARPRKLKTLTSTVASLFPNGISEWEVAELLGRLQASGQLWYPKVTLHMLSQTSNNLVSPTSESVSRGFEILRQISDGDLR